MTDYDHATSDDPFVHEALFYRDADEFLTAILPFIHEGLDADEPVIAALPTRNLRRLVDALGASGARVHLVDLSVEGGNPGRTIPWVYLPFAAAHSDRPIRIIGEPIWPGRTADEYPGCVQHEALANVIFSGRQARGLCLYDVTSLEPHVVADAATTHPILFGRHGRQTSARYADPYAVAEAFNRPLPDLGPPVVSFSFDAATLGEARRLAAQHAAYAGMEPQRGTALHTAVNEVATNSVIHGGGRGTLRIFRDADRLICEISDAGRIIDPLAGRLWAKPGDGDVSGLVLVHRICDLVQVHTGDSGTTTRLHMRLSTARG